MSTERPWLQHYPPDIVPEPKIPDQPVFRFVSDSAERYPDLTAVRFYGLSVTYAQLWQQIERAAALFATSGVRPGNRVALMLPNCPHSVGAYHGALRAGASVVQVNPLYTPRELQYILNNSEAETIVVADALYPVV